MKKFLFTLAALLMAGSVYADSYLYVPAVEITDEMINEYGEVEIPVALHSEKYISAFQAKVESVPEGLTLVDAYKGGDFTITYKNNRGRDAQSTSEIFIASVEDFGFFGAQAEAGYYQAEGSTAWTSYGVVKWAPGDYEEFVMLVFEVDKEAFKGGHIVISTTFSCGDEDERPEVVGNTWTDDTLVNTNAGGEITLAGQEEPAQPAPVPTLTWSEESFTMEATCENHEVVLMINGEAVSNPYTVAQTYEEQTITFVAYTVANADESGNSANVEQTVTVPAMAKTPSNKPSVVVTPGDNEYTIEATGTGTVVLYVNGAEVENPYTIARPAYGEDDITVEAYATNLDSDPEGEIQYEIATSDAQPVVVPAKEPTYYYTPDPVITVNVDNEAETVTITATGEGAVTLKVTGFAGTVGEAEGEGTCSVVVPFGEEIDYVNAYATATAAGEFVYPGDATENMIEIPAKKKQTAKPVITTQDTGSSIIVTATGNGTVILYNDDVEVARGEGSASYEIPYTEDPEGEEMGFSATAQAEGELVSDYARAVVFVPGKQPVDTTLDGELVFSEVNQENGQFTVTYTGDEAVTITLDNEAITLVRSTANTYQLPAYGTYEVTATATGVGYDPISKPATLVWNAPVVPVVPPTITIDTDNDNYQVIVGAVAPQGDVTLYRVEDLDGTNPVEIGNPTPFAMEAESYTVYVMAKTVVDGVEYWSTVSQVVVPAKPVNPEDPTSINEMNAGKTVAAVRYFNMAGQEMQEANGMTIVVTTYTDGTTSAVKVMK